MEKREFGWIYVYIVLAVAVLSAPYWLWWLKPEMELNLLIVDETVPDRSYREHQGLVWLLNQQKYVRSNGERYKAARDYVGFAPKKDGTYTVRPLPKEMGRYDAVYIADTYGVYEEEFVRKQTDGARSAKVHGGLDLKEMEALWQFARQGGKTLIAEFNSMAYPTEKEVRASFAQLFGLQWTGWIGRYFPDLGSREVPIWVKENYKAQYGKLFSFRGPGVVLVDETDRLLVLDQRDLGDEGVVLSSTKAGEAHWGEKMRVPYSYWFDIVKPLDEHMVLATYTLSLSERGKEKLWAIGLPLSFPAVVRYETKTYQSYYFCGDYADQGELPSVYQTVGLDVWRKWTVDGRPDTGTAFYWKAYVPMMKAILREIKGYKKEGTPQVQVQTAKQEGVRLAGTVGRDYLQVYRNGRWEPLLIKGVNLGISKPGVFPGEAKITKEDYFRWLQYIGAMGANAIRVYTIHPPAFYEALYEYNETAKRPIYLFHGVWIDEGAMLRAKDAFARPVDEAFRAEIRRTIDLIHGNADIPKRPGHAGGVYRYDLSPYVLGWIFGVEWDPDVVIATNKKHSRTGDYKGVYIYTKGASPFESWLARTIDEAIAYETKTYGWQRPVSFTNWVTTDFLRHPAEPFVKEDLVSVNPNVVYATDQLRAGLFASYHIYPYYPDFLNKEEKYLNYMDWSGELNSYAGYLHDMKAAHRMPVLVAEFGVPSSRGMAHRNVHGKNQGFLSEQEQGEIDRKLFKDIVHERMAGGLLFSWQDEWFKRTWNTMEYDTPDRRPFWLNVQTNEQHFGLLRFDPGPSAAAMIKVDGRKDDWTFNGIKPAWADGKRALYVTSDEGYLYMRLDSGHITDETTVYIAFDTIPNQGQSRLPGLPIVRTAGIDFALVIHGKESARLLIDSYYDTFYYHYGHQLHMMPAAPYANRKDNGIYHPIRLALNKKLEETRGKVVPFDSYETGILRFGTANPADAAFDSLADISVSHSGDMYEIRLPWALLNVTDPSRREVMGDIWSKGGLKSRRIVPGIRLGLYVADGADSFSFPAMEGQVLPAKQFYTYKWPVWDAPRYHERLKQSYEEMKKAFSDAKVGWP
ncbi:hypothetical protein LG52_980 [Geobacillus kaustophilus]|uniref:Uncharacterized protein n=1 Tax=Geobacillus kaustophilus TaxID=1462 RepID=A0A0D8BUB8_GEOKU|nr:hypothetical protein [Geobacillus kaustophilus]KJE27756.1 hypothetical protein LG52_980 [Geobacillus kaustophilus]